MQDLTNSYLGLISTLTPHINGVTELLTKLTNKDHASEVSLQVSLIQSLTALADTLDLMARVSPEPLATEYRRECIMALMRTIEDVRGLGHEDVTVIGTFLGVRCSRMGQTIILE